MDTNPVDSSILNREKSFWALINLKSKNYPNCGALSPWLMYKIYIPISVGRQMIEKNYHLLGLDRPWHPPSFSYTTRAITRKLKSYSVHFKTFLLAETTFPQAVAIFQLGVYSYLSCEFLVWPLLYSQLWLCISTSKLEEYILILPYIKERLPWTCLLVFYLLSNQF